MGDDNNHKNLVIRKFNALIEAVFDFRIEFEKDLLKCY